MGWSKITYYFIFCNGCGKEFQEYYGESIKDTREKAKDKGWTHKPGRDYCPKCQDTNGG